MYNLNRPFNAQFCHKANFKLAVESFCIHKTRWLSISSHSSDSATSICSQLEGPNPPTSRCLFSIEINAPLFGRFALNMTWALVSFTANTVDGIALLAL